MKNSSILGLTALFALSAFGGAIDCPRLNSIDWKSGAKGAGRRTKNRWGDRGKSFGRSAGQKKFNKVKQKNSIFSKYQPSQNPHSPYHW